MSENTIMHPYMWWSILKSMNKSIFLVLSSILFVTRLSLTMPSVNKSSCLHKSSFFQSFKGGRKLVPGQVIQQPHIYFILSNNSYCSMMKDIFYSFSTALEDLDISLEVHIVFKLGAEALLLQGIHANSETWFQ